MSKYKFEKLRDSDGDIKGYKLGNNTLIKHYYWGNDYEWFVSREGREYAGFGTEITKRLMTGALEIAHSCKDGKQRLIDLYEQED